MGTSIGKRPNSYRMGNEDTVPMFHFSVSRFLFLVSRFTNIPTTLASHQIFSFSLDFYSSSGSGAFRMELRIKLGSPYQLSGRG